MNQTTRKCIDRFSPMWTNKQIWEFEQINRNLKFDVLCVKAEAVRPGESELAYTDAYIRDVVDKTLDYLSDGYELRIANKNQGKLEEQHIPYLMAVLADKMIEEETCLNFKTEDKCLITSINMETDVIDCKEFFEEFYHLITGFNYDTDIGIPDDPILAEIYFTRLQEEFDGQMELKLGDKYMPGNSDPDT